MINGQLITASLRETEGKVIDDLMIRTAIDEEVRVVCEEKEETIPDPIPLHKTEKLVLSYRRVTQLSNLSTMENLRELRLDNNRISKIENLDHLVNLTWLDLSFNQISVIEGLSSLTKLSDLSLFQNNISEIKGVESLVNLEVLSLCNNKIPSVDQLLVLRPLTALKVLSLAGNPLSEDREYRTTCLAFLKNIKYLDYLVTEEAEIRAAQEASTQVEELLEVEEKESIERASRLRETARLEAVRDLEAANIDVVETLFDDMFKDDTEMVKVRLLPGLQAILDDYREKFATVAETLKHQGLAKNKLILAEVGAFTEAVDETTQADADSCIAEVAKYQRQQKHAFREFYADSPGALYALGEAAESLSSGLLSREMKIAEQVQGMIDVLDTALNDLRLAKLSAHQKFFRSMENYEGKYYEAVQALGEELLKQAAEEGASLEDMGDELAALLQERDTLMGAVTGSHDIHISAIIAREDEMTSRENARCKAAITGARNKERNRNRDRIHEIKQMLVSHKAVIQEALDEAREDHDD